MRSGADYEAVAAVDALHGRLRGYLHAIQEDPQARAAHMQMCFMQGELAPGMRAISGDLQFLADSVHSATTVDWTVLVKADNTYDGTEYTLCIVASTTAQRAGELALAHMKQDARVQRRYSESLGWYEPEYRTYRSYRVVKVTEVRRDEYIGEVPTKTEDGHRLVGPVRCNPRTPEAQAARHHYNTTSMQDVDMQAMHGLQRRIKSTSETGDAHPYQNPLLQIFGSGRR